jgi:hypothetical protein
MPFSIHMVAARNMPERMTNSTATNRAATSAKMLHCTERSIGNNARRSTIVTAPAVAIPHTAVGIPSAMPKAEAAGKATAVAAMPAAAA